MQSELKTAAKRALEPIAAALSAIGLTANAVTAVGLGISFVACAMFGTGHMRWAAVALVASGLCDALDGTMARRAGRVTPFGAFLDSTVDRYADGAALSGVAWWAGMHGHPVLCGLALAAVIGSFAVSYTRARAEGLGQSCNVGWLERPERVVVLIAGAIAGATALPWFVGALAVGSNVTAVQRIVHVHRAFQASRDSRA